MMAYILYVLIHWGSGTTSSSIDFPTFETCKIAAEEVKKAYGGNSLIALCLSREKPNE